MHDFVVGCVKFFTAVLAGYTWDSGRAVMAIAQLFGWELELAEITLDIRHTRCSGRVILLIFLPICISAAKFVDEFIAGRVKAFTAVLAGYTWDSGRAVMAIAQLFSRELEFAEIALDTRCTHLTEQINLFLLLHFCTCRI